MEVLPPARQGQTSGKHSVPASKDIGKSFAWIPHEIRTRLVPSLRMPMHIDTNRQKKRKRPIGRGCSTDWPWEAPREKRFPSGPMMGQAHPPFCMHPFWSWGDRRDSLAIVSNDHFPCFGTAPRRRSSESPPPNHRQARSQRHLVHVENRP